MKITRVPQQLLKRLALQATLEGGEGGHAESQAPQLRVSSARTELVVALDSALGAVCGMFAAALNPDTTGARHRLDNCYEALVTSVEAFREAVPKA